MANRKPSPATPAQITAFGHIAVLLREYIKRTGKTIGEINQALGLERHNPGPYVWLKAKGGPGPENRTKLAKLLGCQPDDLAAKVRGRAPGKAPDAPVAGPVGKMLQQLQRPPGAHPAPRQADVLAFSVTPDGMARIRLDTTLPLDEGAALLRVLLDMNLLLVTVQA